VFSFRRILYPLIVPLVLIVFSAAVLWSWPFLTKKLNGTKELKAFLDILPLLPYIIYSVVILMGWRYNNTGLIMTSLALALSYYVFSRYSTLPLKPTVNSLSISEATAFLIPLNLVFFSLLTKRRIFTSVFLFCLLLVGLQVLAVLLFSRWPGSPDSPLIPLITKISPVVSKNISNISAQLGSFFHQYNLLVLKNILIASLLVHFGAIFFLLIRFLFTRDAMQAGFTGTLLAVFLGIADPRALPVATIYFSAAGLILIITTIESSYFMAYIDELTGLQGRRSLNETLINLGHQYAIAMIDVDHFKKFNDTYGHKTGDQVLKMIAAQLEKITGGAKTFRYGGEEFAAIFPGKFAEEAQVHLEKYRQNLESTPFVVRSKLRPKNTPQSRAKVKSSGQRKVTVTVSIGVASPDKKLTTPEKVIRAADKILYKAKKAGRNRVLV